jgi:glutamyl-tRNA reductase
VAVANRTPERAAELAHRFGATAHGLDELPRLLAGADVVLSSIGADRPLLDAPLFEEALRARRRRPIFAIDLGVPRNVDPVVNRLDGVYLYDVDDLGGVAEANAEERRRETVRAEAIVQEEVERFDGWLSALQAVPTIRRLRARAEAIRQGELDKALGRLGLGETERQAVEALTRAIVNKILHAPVSRLRERAEREEGIAYLEAAKVLFALDDDGAPGAQADARSGGPAGDDEPGADGA